MFAFYPSRNVRDYKKKSAQPKPEMDDSDDEKLLKFSIEIERPKLYTDNSMANGGKVMKNYPCG